MALFPRRHRPRQPERRDLPAQPRARPRPHLLGTTAYGQDIFAQVVWGTRQVLIIAFGAGLASTVLSVLIGVAAAYLGGLSDGVLSLFTDVFLVIPTFPLMIVIAGLRAQHRHRWC